MSNSSGDGFALVLVVLALLAWNTDEPDEQTKPASPKVVEVKVDKAPPRVVTVDYRMRFDWVYTGSPDTYREYAGTQTFRIDPHNSFKADFKDNDVIGLPIHFWVPEATVIQVERWNGEHCNFHIGRRDGAVFCPEAKARQREMIPMATKVTRVGPDHYVVLGAISKFHGLGEKPDTSNLDRM
jgi:hypothetical protein